MHLKRNMSTLEREAQISKFEIGKSDAVATEALNELDIAKFDAGKLAGVLIELQRRLDRLEDVRSNYSDRVPRLESGSDDSWGPGPGPGRPCGCIKAPRSDHVSSTGGSAQRSDPMSPRRSGGAQALNFVRTGLRQKMALMRSGTNR